MFESSKADMEEALKNKESQVKVKYPVFSNELPSAIEAVWVSAASCSNCVCVWRNVLTF